MQAWRAHKRRAAITDQIGDEAFDDRLDAMVVIHATITQQDLLTEWLGIDRLRTRFRRPSLKHRWRDIQGQLRKKRRKRR